ncbi:two-component system sensor histidine kinase [Salmonella enterica subsp. diarizonae]|uniref:histidine kinase n=1 Tax=Salmonella diarizonae TaxID=59204 RepID=A0A379TT73_SALDZ|nr:two-component system sensor histidine kinase [Salmonella enterica subsp. diarizonae]
MLLHDGDNGQDIPYRYRREGFDNGYLKDDNDLWRFLWLNSATVIIVSSSSGVGLREDMALAIRGGAINAVADRPSLHATDFITPASPRAQTVEEAGAGATFPIRRNRRHRSTPKAYRARFAHWSKHLISFLAASTPWMVRERRFTSDAAHELRSPLAALKVQTEVAQLSGDDPLTRDKALTQLHAGIDRATRLVDSATDVIAPRFAR